MTFLVLLLLCVASLATYVLSGVADSMNRIADAMESEHRECCDCLEEDLLASEDEN